MDDATSAPERWLPVAGYVGLYAVSNHGRVESYHRTTPRILRPGRHVAGYDLVVLCQDGAQTSRTVHSLVLEAFAGLCPEGMESRHLDGNPQNNRWEPGGEEETRAAGGNLIYGTSGANNLDQVQHGTHNNASKEKCPEGHDYTLGNTIVINAPDGSGQRRGCRKCRESRSKGYRDNEARPPIADEECCTDEEGCDRRKVAQDLCRKHYMRQWQRKRAADALASMWRSG